MTVTKEGLREALAREDAIYEDDRVSPDMLAAARFVERLLSGTCEKCSGLSVRTAKDPYAICPSCHGAGQLWDEGLVEVVAKALAPYSWDDSPGLHETHRATARAVLSALTAEASK